MKTYTQYQRQSPTVTTVTPCVERKTNTVEQTVGNGESLFEAIIRRKKKRGKEKEKITPEVSEISGSPGSSLVVFLTSRSTPGLGTTSPTTSGDDRRKPSKKKGKEIKRWTIKSDFAGTGFTHEELKDVFANVQLDAWDRAEMGQSMLKRNG